MHHRQCQRWHVEEPRDVGVPFGAEPRPVNALAAYGLHRTDRYMSSANRLLLERTLAARLVGPKQLLLKTVVHLVIEEQLVIQFARCRGHMTLLVLDPLPQEKKGQAALWVRVYHENALTL